MSVIDLDALEALMQAITESHDDMKPKEFVCIVRRLDDLGWQLTRVPALPFEYQPPCEPAPAPPAMIAVPDELPF